MRVSDGSGSQIFKWEKTTLSWSPVKDIMYYRNGFSNIGTPISTEIEKWCVDSNITTSAPQVDILDFEQENLSSEINNSS